MNCRAVRVSVSGTEDVMATNNGDPTDQTAYPSIARRLCRLMQGDITATSEPERGSRFVIHLPVGSGAV